MLFVVDFGNSQQGGPWISVDFGTAATYDVVSRGGEYLALPLGTHPVVGLVHQTLAAATVVLTKGTQAHIA